MTTSDQCSPRWIIYHNQAAFGASWNKDSPTRRKCLYDCDYKYRTSCTAAEWTNYTCWLHYTDGYRHRSPRNGTTQFEIVRGCETSGMVMPQSGPARPKRVNVLHTVSGKCATLFLPLSLPNVDRFSKFFNAHT